MRRSARRRGRRRPISAARIWRSGPRAIRRASSATAIRSRTSPNGSGRATTEAYIKNYLDSQFGSYNHPNSAIEPRIPGIFQYYSVAEDELAKGYAGEYKSAQETADAIAAAWEKITDQIGRDGQIKLYKASLGMM